MPIPTDTFWNVKRLNLVFAASGVFLMGVMIWATLQDFNQAWRDPQRHGKVWEAAFVDEKIERDTTPEKEAEIAQLTNLRSELAAKLGPATPETKKRTELIQKLLSEQADMEFRLNTLKANVGVDESQLQDAVTAGDQARVTALTKKLEKPRQTLAESSEALAAKKDQVNIAKSDLAEHTAPLDAVNKQITKLESDVLSLRKKRATLLPQGLLPNISNHIRETPLMQFINPATGVKQVVLSDIRTSLGGVKEVETIDRCITCHVNIDKKEFGKANVIEYLEEQVATSRQINLPEQAGGRSSDPAATRTRPGAVAMPEFWHLWANKIAQDVVRKPAALNRISTLAKTVGKPASVTIDGNPLAGFNYMPDAAKKEDAASAALDPATRDQIIAELLKAWIDYSGETSTTGTGRIKVTLPAGLDDKTTAPPRSAAMKYVEDVRSGLIAALPPQTLSLLDDRYRRALITLANVARKGEGLKLLDPSPALLAHPRLDLYVDPDSKHSMEAVGCTSCHDGSGQETEFVLTAHTPRSIWVDEKTGEPVLPAQIDAGKLPASDHGPDLSSMLGAVYPHDDVVPSRVADIHLELNDHGQSHATTQAATTQPHEAAPGRPHVPEEPPVDSPPVAYVNPATGTSGKAVSQMTYWERKYEPSAPRSFKLVYHEWDWPMRPPKYLQANCVRCHTDVNSIKTDAPKVFEGRSLFINLGCVNCHQMDSIPAESLPANPSDIRLITSNGQRKVGSDLRNITAKLSPAYINTWIWAPKAFRPSTKMPHFFMLENNSSDEEIRRTRQEARAITEYLLRTANQYPQTDAGGQPVLDKAGQPVAGPLPPESVIPAGAKGSAEAGKAIFAGIGCMGCHTNLNDDTGEKRGGKAITLAEKWIVTDLTKSGKLAQKMESETGLTPDAKATSARAAELYDHMTYNERQLYITENLAPDYLGMPAKYPDGTLKPIFQHHGPELSGVGTKLTAGRTPEQARAWLFDWVSNPQHYNEYTVMPRLRLSNQQALDLAEYLLAQKRTNDKPDDPWKADLTTPDTEKLIELTGLFLRSRFSAKVAQTRADDETELTALAADALTTANTPIEFARKQAQALSKDERRMVFLGKKLIANYGCMSCHAINGTENVSSPCANLSDWGQKGLDKLDFGYLDHHKLETLNKDEHGMPLPSVIPMVNGMSAKASGLTAADYRANFADGHVAAPVTVGWPHVGHSRTGWLTQKLLNTRIYDRGRGLLEPKPEAADPGKPYDKLKMPTFYIGDREADAIVTWVISNRDRLISHKLLTATLTPQAQQIAKGRQLSQKFNCVGCHVIEGNLPSVQQFYKPDDIPTKAPPSLRGEGNKIQHAWLFNFLKHVEPLRPLLYMTPDTKPGIRMPSFPITDDEATAIAAYFNAVSTREAKSLAKQMVVIKKYIQMQQDLAAKPVTGVPKTPTTLPVDQAKTLVEQLVRHAGAMIAKHDPPAAIEALTQADAIATAEKLDELVGATTKPVSTRLKDAIEALNDNRIPDSIPWPGDDWFTRPEFASTAMTLKSWALDNKQIAELQLDPTKNKPAEIARTYRTILFKAEFVEGLYNSPYPFVDTPRPEITDERFKKGESFFYDMQCLKCHVLGEANVAGAQKNPTAPNLALASRRLQRRWVRDWVQEPAIIQIGTAMPPFFTGAGIFDVHGQAWPRSQGSPPAEIKRVETIYGSTADEQADLLLDFLYAAGVRGYTGVQPTPAEAAPTEPVKKQPAATTATTAPTDSKAQTKPAN